MAYFFPEGTRLFFSQNMGAIRNITLLTNAAGAVATATAHGFTTGSEIALTSGWDDATDSVYRVTNLTADTFRIEGLNTTDTTLFPAGGGLGSARAVTNWVEIPGVLDVSTQGGDVRFATVSPLARRTDINVPTGFNAMSINLTMSHDPANATYQSLIDITRAMGIVNLRMTIPGGIVALGRGYISVNESPTLQRNQANSVTAAVTLLGRFISYGGV